jgi:hypothetical protein
MARGRTVNRRVRNVGSRFGMDPFSDIAQPLAFPI